MIQTQEKFLKTPDGTKIFYQLHLPSSLKPRGFILVVHGFCEHSGRYADVIQAINQQNLACALFDIRGHGKSGPARGDADNFHALLLDLIFVFHHTKEQLKFTNNEVTGIVAHSFGSLLTTYASAMMGIDSPPVFLSSPCYQIKQSLPGWKKFFALKIAKYAPTLNASTKIEFQHLSNNEKSNTATSKDQLYLTAISARMGNIFLNALLPEKVLQAISLVRVPVTIVASGDDKLVDTNVTKKYVTHFSNANFAIIPKAGHEIFNETEILKNQAFKLLNQWLKNLN